MDITTWNKLMLQAQVKWAHPRREDNTGSPDGGK